MKNQKKLYIVGFILIIFLFSVFLITTPDPLLRKEGAQAIPSKSQAENPPFLDQGGARGGNSATLVAGATTAHLSFAPNTLFYDALAQAKNVGQIDFEGKNYPGLGFFVTDIGTLHTGSGKHLLYYINGTEATVGVSSYTLKDNDIIEWKLE